ncbi:MAG: helix-hairpin-helix domain-containing protein [Campylobacterota bacterium]|nr:helix-hairpin-helix domain-containing protein [Campylobacterota bacterium]
MKNPNRETISKLEALPNIGKAIGSDLILIGISEPKNLIGENPFDLYDKLCIKKGKCIDPCVIDVFMSAVDFMEGGEAQPWWNFTQRRKQILKKKK